MSRPIHKILNNKWKLKPSNNKGQRNTYNISQKMFVKR